VTATVTTAEFSGRTALVTGGSRGIGRATSLLLARAGAKVAVNYVNDGEAADAIRSKIERDGGVAHIVKADVSDPEQIAEAVRATERELGPVELLVCSAGTGERGDHSELTYESWQRVMKVNLDGTFLPVMAVKDAMIRRGYGRIVCVSSIAALRPRPQNIAYATSKAAVIAFVRNCAPGFAPEVRINAIAPGLIETDMVAGMDPARRQAMIEATPMQRLGEPEEIAEMALFLLSERSSYTTGQTLIAAGGRVTIP
jgi:3-oxoacyl-[acyl-carrier protein] reductase